VKNGRQKGPPLQHDDGVNFAEFSPDGSLLVTAGEDAAARVWEASTGTLLFTLKHQSSVTEARFSSDGRWIVTAAQRSGIARVWDAQTGESLTPPLQHPWHFLQAQFIDDNRKILTRRARDQGGTPTLWDLPIETRSLEELAELEKLLSGHQMDLNGAVLPQKPADLQKTWMKLFAHPPKNFTVAPGDIIRWHIREAEACEMAQQWNSAVFHWTQLVQAKPVDKTFQDRLNHALDQLK
jgi:WD40 repeat protein